MAQVTWGAGREQDFVAWIDVEIRNAQTARLGLDQQHREWLSQYRVSAKQGARNFPYEGAFNYQLPLTAIDVDILYARFMQTIHASDSIWSVSPMNERWQAAAKPLQDFLTVLDQRKLKMYNVNKRVFLECVKLGTGIYKTQWNYERRKVWTNDASGARVRVERIESAPVVDHVRLADFLLPAYSYAIQPDDQGGAPWVAERLRISIAKLRSMAAAQAPFAPNIDPKVVDIIARYEEPEKPASDLKLQELDYARSPGGGSPTALDGDAFDKDQERGPANGASLQRPKEIELWEVHARFPSTEASDSEDDIVVWYHIPTRRVVRAVYAQQNWRPYDKIVYFPGDGFWGVGVCEQKEMFQTLGSDLMNFTLDNVILANSRAIVAKAGANISPGEPIYPWKVFLTEGDVRSEFGVFPMADIYQSLPMIQSFIGNIGEKRTGIGDLQTAQLNELPGRTPAATMQSLLQEGSRRPDLTIRDMRNEGLSIVGMRILQLCQQYMSSPLDVGGAQWQQTIKDILGEPEGSEVVAKLSNANEPIELGVGCTLTATSGINNKEAERQGSLALLQLAGQVTPQIIQLVQLASQSQGTPVGDVALNAAEGIDTLYRRALEQFDVRDVEKIAFLMEAIAPAPQGGVAAPAPGAGAPPFGSAGPAVDPQMAAMLSGMMGT